MGTLNTNMGQIPLTDFRSIYALLQAAQANSQSQNEAIQEIANATFERVYNMYSREVEAGGYLTYNPLSENWQLDHIKQNPIKNGTINALFWPLGMVGYALSLPIRVTLFVVTLIGSLQALWRALNHSSLDDEFTPKERVLSILGSFGELISGAIGCVAPPIGYKMDEWIQRNPDIHKYYLSFLMPMSYWSAEFQASASPNRERMILKDKELKPLYPCFVKARTHLENYVYEENVETENLNNVKEIGLFLSVLEQKDLSKLLMRAHDTFQTKNEDNSQIDPKRIKELTDIQEGLGYELRPDPMNQNQSRFVKNFKGSIEEHFDILCKKYKSEDVIQFVVMNQLPQNNENEYYKNYSVKEYIKNSLTLDEEDLKSLKIIKEMLIRVRGIMGRDVESTRLIDKNVFLTKTKK